jgi:Uma2 family endonuclease
MVATPEYNYISLEEYLQAEEHSPIKHEYRNGYIYAMAGASNNHVLITVNLITLLRNRLRGSGCLIYSSDTKSHIEDLNIYYYPDVMVSCDQRDRSFDSFLRYPCLIIEVLSPTTEAFDRGDKFADYRHLGALQEYVLVSQNRMNIDVFRCNAEGQFVLYSYGEKDTVDFASVDFKCAVTDIYEDVIFPSAQLPESINE